MLRTAPEASKAVWFRAVQLFGGIVIVCVAYEIVACAMRFSRREELKERCREVRVDAVVKTRPVWYAQYSLPILRTGFRGAFEDITDVILIGASKDQVELMLPVLRHLSALDSIELDECTSSDSIAETLRHDLNNVTITIQYPSSGHSFRPHRHTE